LNAETVGDEFLAWYGETLRVLAEVFGRDSTQMREFLYVRFGMQEDILRQIETRVSTAFAVEPQPDSDHVSVVFRNRLLGRGLSEAYELLLALELELGKVRAEMEADGCD
jgi:hypothetical protein